MAEIIIVDRSREMVNPNIGVLDPLKLDAQFRRIIQHYIGIGATAIEVGSPFVFCTTEHFFADMQITTAPGVPAKMMYPISYSLMQEYVDVIKRLSDRYFRATFIINGLFLVNQNDKEMVEFLRKNHIYPWSHGEIVIKGPETGIAPNVSPDYPFYPLCKNLELSLAEKAANYPPKKEWAVRTAANYRNFLKDNFLTDASMCIRQTTASDYYCKTMLFGAYGGPWPWIVDDSDSAYLDILNFWKKRQINFPGPFNFLSNDYNIMEVKPEKAVYVNGYPMNYHAHAGFQFNLKICSDVINSWNISELIYHYFNLHNQSHPMIFQGDSMPPRLAFSDLFPNAVFGGAMGAAYPPDITLDWTNYNSNQQYILSAMVKAPYIVFADTAPVAAYDANALVGAVYRAAAPFAGFPLLNPCIFNRVNPLQRWGIPNNNIFTSSYFEI